MKADQIEMVEMNVQSNPIGTEIFGKGMPSDIDFHDKELTSDRPMQTEVALQCANRAKIDEEIIEFKIKGKVNFYVEASMRVGDIVAYTGIQTHEVRRIGGQAGTGWSGVWQMLVGYANRELFLHQGHIYVLEKRKDQRVVCGVHPLKSLLKMFVLRQDEQVRLVFQEQGKWENYDFQTSHLRSLIKALTKFMSAQGLTLSNEGPRYKN